MDDPTIEPRPPNAGFDRYEADRFGKFNGVDGYQIHFEDTRYTLSSRMPESLVRTTQLSS